MLANLAPSFLFFFLLFGDDGHFGDITKLAIEDTQKIKNKERKKGKNHYYYCYLTGAYTRNVVPHTHTYIAFQTLMWMLMFSEHLYTNIIKVQQYQFDILIVSSSFLNMHFLVTWKRMNEQSIDAPTSPPTSHKQNL